MDFQVASVKRTFFNVNEHENIKKQILDRTSYSSSNLLSLYGPMLLTEMTKISNAKSRSRYHMNLFINAQEILENFLENLMSLMKITSASNTSCEFITLSGNTAADESEYLNKLPWKIQTISHNIESLNIPLLRAKIMEVASVFEHLQSLSSEIEKLDDVLSLRNQSATSGRLARNG